MQMKRLEIGFGLVVATALAVAPVASAAEPAESVVPPGNSAATQYTESIPTGGGGQDVEKKSQKSHRSPAQVLGPDNVRRLQSQGPAGRATAELATATAPTMSATSAGNVSPGPSRESSDRTSEGGSAQSHHAGQAGSSRPQAEEPSGSSGLEAVIAQATGSSSGQMGVFLPLALLGAVLWAFVYCLRQRRQVG
jgi:hypothetical protein